MKKTKRKEMRPSELWKLEHPYNKPINVITDGIKRKKAKPTLHELDERQQ